MNLGALYGVKVFFAGIILLTLSVSSLASSAKIAELERLVKNGNLDAQFYLAVMYTEGKELPVDLKKAFDLFLDAAQQGHPGSQHNLAIMYRNGYGTTVDVSEARKWIIEAAYSGVAEDQAQLGRMLEEGVLGDPNIEKAIYWYKKAAVQGVGYALGKLGLMYNGGEGVKSDWATSCLLLKLALKQGSESISSFKTLTCSLLMDKEKERIERFVLVWQPGDLIPFP